MTLKIYKWVDGRTGSYKVSPPFDLEHFAVLRMPYWYLWIIVIAWINWHPVSNLKKCEPVFNKRCLSFSFQRFVAKVSDQVTPSAMTVPPWRPDDFAHFSHLIDLDARWFADFYPQQLYFSLVQIYFGKCLYNVLQINSPPQHIFLAVWSWPIFVF